MTLTFCGVSKTVAGKTHIHQTDLSLARGTMNVLLGATLSGKTSLMRLMAGLDKPTTGQILWHDEDVTGVRVQKRNIAMVYQQFINYPSLTVYENIASPLRLQGKSKSEINRAVRKIAEMLKLTAQLDARPLSLSGGQQQRCALARALVKGAGLVLLDEPLANLDYKLREELRAEIPKMFEASGAIFVYATTEPEEALLLGGNTAAMYQGKITQFGPTHEVYRQPLDITTARIFSNPPMNFLPVSKTGTSLNYADGHNIPLKNTLPDGAYMAGFRPHHLHLQPQGEAQMVFKCQVDISEITGSDTYLHLHFGDRKWTSLLEGIHPHAGQEVVRLYLNPARLYWFNAQGKLVAHPGAA
jgi:glycerol transport system ATP-binding protein